MAIGREPGQVRSLGGLHSKGNAQEFQETKKDVVPGWYHLEVTPGTLNEHPQKP